MVARVCICLFEGVSIADNCFAHSRRNKSIGTDTMVRTSLVTHVRTRRETVSGLGKNFGQLISFHSNSASGKLSEFEKDARILSTTIKGSATLAL